LGPPDDLESAAWCPVVEDVDGFLEAAGAECVEALQEEEAAEHLVARSIIYPP
jgi:hypothetical protein